MGMLIKIMFLYYTFDWLMVQGMVLAHWHLQLYWRLIQMGLHAVLYKHQQRQIINISPLAILSLMRSIFATV